MTSLLDQGPSGGLQGNGGGLGLDTSFALSRPHDSIVGAGRVRTILDPHEAAALLRSGRIDAIAGALPFDIDRPAALTVPEAIYRTDRPLPAAATDLPRISLARELPSPETHTARIRELLEVISARGLDKVVLARAIELTSEGVVEPLSVLARLINADSAGNGFYVALGEEHEGAHLVGSSPEVLVRREGHTVTCHPLAGSLARSVDSATDRARGRQLLRSAKDQAEHAFVIDALTSALAPLCTTIHAPTSPVLTWTPALWHLGTPITATLRDPATTALDLALSVHPTPAICGTPTAEAKRAILEIEDERGFYSGAVGWCDRQGDGEWMVTIRSARIDASLRTVLAHAGSGLVAGSEPEAELEETTVKLSTILSALGLRP